MQLGFLFDVRHRSVGAGQAARLSVDEMWRITSLTGSAIVRIFEPKQRKQLSGIVGIYTVTQQTFAFDIPAALELLAIVSLSLALINLFPFLPLDGGHIFWAIVEKLRGGKPVSIRVMERATIIGFAFVLMLMVIGVSNDIGRITGEGFNVSK
jgi:regulator of sigma E protease